ncbi:hypothetical protein X801_03464, partial [Opisthorchis viverrini]
TVIPAFSTPTSHTMPIASHALQGLQERPLRPKSHVSHPSVPGQASTQAACLSASAAIPAGEFQFSTSSTASRPNPTTSSVPVPLAPLLHPSVRSTVPTLSQLTPILISAGMAPSQLAEQHHDHSPLHATITSTTTTTTATAHAVTRIVSPVCSTSTSTAHTGPSLVNSGTSVQSAGGTVTTTTASPALGSVSFSGTNADSDGTDASALVPVAWGRVVRMADGALHFPGIGRQLFSNPQSVLQRIRAAASPDDSFSLQLDGQRLKLILRELLTCEGND